MKIRIIGTEQECEVAADRIARVLTARYVSRPSSRYGPSQPYSSTVSPTTSATTHIS